MPKPKYLRIKSADLRFFLFSFTLFGNTPEACVEAQLSARNATTNCFDPRVLIMNPQKISACGGRTFCHLVIEHSRISGSGNTITSGCLNCLINTEEINRSSETQPLLRRERFLREGILALQA